VVSVEVLDEHYNMEAEGKNNRMNLSVVSMISLRSTVSLEDENPLEVTSEPGVWWTRNQSSSVQLVYRACSTRW
jgi:hypothetical protein